MVEDKQYEKWLDFGFYEVDKRYADKLMKLRLPELIQEYESQLTFSEKDGYFLVKNWDYYQAVRQEMLNRLQVTETDFLKRLMCEIEESLKASFKELEDKFKNHRHSIEKTYGEKPVW